MAVFSLDGDSDPTVPGQRTFNNLSPGNHVVTETPVAGCLDPDIRGAILRP